GQRHRVAARLPGRVLLPRDPLPVRSAAALLRRQGRAGQGAGAQAGPRADAAGERRRRGRGRELAQRAALRAPASALAARTEVGAALAEHDATDLRAAVRARLALAGVDAAFVLVGAVAAVGRDVVADAGAARLDRAQHHALHACDDRVALGARDAAGGAP